MTVVSGAWLSAPRVQRVFDAIAAAGHPAWAVGGCVRNALLRTAVVDVDLATPALPDSVAAAAEAAGLKAVPTGLAHGTITIVSDGVPVEVTTFRRDVATDGRHAVVAFTDQMEEDARRRDFTMNALYADRAGAVTDPLGGLPDLLARRVRFIDRAEDRIREDRLRILRFYRFFAWYGAPGAEPDAEGQAAAAAAAGGLDALSRERVGAEMRKLLAAPDPEAALRAMAAAGVLARVLPGAETGSLRGLLAAETAFGLAPAWARRLALLGGPGDLADRFRLSRAEQRRLTAIAEAEAADGSVAASAYRHGAEAARDAALIRAARAGHAPPSTLLAEAARGAAQRFPLTAADLSGNIAPGPALGQALKAMEAAWIASDFQLSRDALLARLDIDAPGKP